jgi:hypothetical protein
MFARGGNPDRQLT